MLNSMKISKEALAGILGAGRSVNVSLPKRSFATGGPVRASRFDTRGVSQVIQFHDEQTMERALAAGPDSMIRFSRRRRGGMRAALGLDTTS